jgi:hypothetical protein
LRQARALMAGTLVAIPAVLFLVLWMHAPREFGAVVACGLGLAVFLVVVTGTDAHDAAADAAWQLAAAELPPVSDRATMELDQAVMPGPVKSKPAGGQVPDAPGSSAAEPASHLEPKE